MIRKYEIRRYINYSLKIYKNELNKVKRAEYSSEEKKVEAKTQAFENAIVDLFRKLLKNHFDLTEKDVEKILLPVFLSCVRRRSVTNTIEYLRKKGIGTYSTKTVFAELREIRPEDIKPFVDCCRTVLIGIGKHFGLTLRNLIIAIDINAILYYGDHSPLEVMGNERKAGTNWTFKYLTCSIVVEGIRFVVESTPLTQLSLVPKEVGKLIKSAQKLGKVQLVLLDRAFNGVEYQDVINTLKEKFLMPMVKNKKINKVVENEKAELKQIDYTYYENRAIEYQRKVKVIITDEETEGKKHLFITNIVCKDRHKLRLLVETYRKRWGIETQFREKNKFCAFTCTNSFNARNIFQQIAYLLQDGWVLINFILLHEQGKLERWWEMTNANEFFEILYEYTIKLKKGLKMIVISFHFIDELVEIFRSRIRLLYPT